MLLSPIFTDTDHIPFFLIQEFYFDPAFDMSDDELAGRLNQLDDGLMNGTPGLDRQLSQLHLDGSDFDLTVDISDDELADRLNELDDGLMYRTAGLDGHPSQLHVSGSDFDLMQGTVS